jgi:hypothetical protein
MHLGAKETREQLEGFLWAWDEAIQDELAAQEYGTSSSYQLGRGLAEIYWALDPDARSGPESWEKLLGDERATALRLLLDRLSLTVLPSVSTSAIEFALGKWEQFAKDLLLTWEAVEKDGNQAFRAEAGEDLKVHVKKWKDLLLMAADSTDFDDLGTIADASRSSRHIFAFYLRRSSSARSRPVLSGSVCTSSSPPERVTKHPCRR